VNWAYSKESALDFLDKDRPQVIVIGEELSGESSLEFVKELVRRDPFINCALVSSLSPGNFHEKTEGLGVFMQLPAHPGAEEAGRMAGLLEAIGMPVGKA
jgi:two-component SAPR family response regulator